MIKKFLLRYALYTALLFALFYLPSNPLSVALNALQTKLTLTLLSTTLWQDAVKGIDIWINPHYRIYISQACNGFIPILILYASLLAYPARWRRRIVWMVMGYILFDVVNVVRLIFVSYMTKIYGPQAFGWAHDIVGNAMLMITGLLLFVTFVKGVGTENGI